MARGVVSVLQVSMTQLDSACLLQHNQTKIFRAFSRYRLRKKPILLSTCVSSYEAGSRVVSYELVSCVICHEAGLCVVSYEVASCVIHHEAGSREVSHEPVSCMICHEASSCVIS